MDDEPLKTIEREVKSWPGVTTGDTGRGGYSLVTAGWSWGTCTARASQTSPFLRRCATSS